MFGKDSKHDRLSLAIFTQCKGRCHTKLLILTAAVTRSGAIFDQRPKTAGCCGSTLHQPCSVCPRGCVTVPTHPLVACPRMGGGGGPLVDDFLLGSGRWVDVSQSGWRALADEPYRQPEREAAAPIVSAPARRTTSAGSPHRIGNRTRVPLRARQPAVASVPGGGSAGLSSVTTAAARHPAPTWAVGVGQATGVPRGRSASRQFEVPCPPGTIPGEEQLVRLPDGRKCLVRVPGDVTGDRFFVQWAPIVNPAQNKRQHNSSDPAASAVERRWRHADALIATQPSSTVINFLSQPPRQSKDGADPSNGSGPLRPLTPTRMGVFAPALSSAAAPAGAAGAKRRRNTPQNHGGDAAMGRAVLDNRPPGACFDSLNACDSDCVLDLNSPRLSSPALMVGPAFASMTRRPSGVDLTTIAT
jgi:hypothetical protein